MSSLQKRLKSNVSENLIRPQLDAAAQLARSVERKYQDDATGDHAKPHATQKPQRSRKQRRADRARAEKTAKHHHADIEAQFRAYEKRRAAGGKPETQLEVAFETAIAQAEAGRAQEHGHDEDHAA